MSSPGSEHLGNQKPLSRYLAIAVAGVFVGLGVVAAVAPDAAIASSRYMVSPVGIYAAAALRSGIGIALLLVASGSRAPAILRIIGVALIAMALGMPILGVDSAKARIEWEAGHLFFLRVEGALFVWAGLVLYELSKPPKKECSNTPPNTSLERTPER